MREIRNPQSAIRNKPEARNPKGDGPKQFFGFRISDFLRISDFGFRISAA